MLIAIDTPAYVIVPKFAASVLTPGVRYLIVNTGGILPGSGSFADYDGASVILPSSAELNYFGGIVFLIFDSDDNIIGSLAGQLLEGLPGDPIGTVNGDVTGRVIGNSSSPFIGVGVETSGGGDPLANPVPGSYAPGTAGYLLGKNLNAAISAVIYFLTNLGRR